MKKKKIKIYHMCKSQPAQIDCRDLSCKYNTGGGECSNPSPAITLNMYNADAYKDHPNMWTCWSKKEMNI